MYTFQLNTSRIHPNSKKKISKSKLLHFSTQVRVSYWIVQVTSTHPSQPSSPRLCPDRWRPGIIIFGPFHTKPLFSLTRRCIETWHGLRFLYIQYAYRILEFQQVLTYVLFIGQYCKNCLNQDRILLGFPLCIIMTIPLFQLQFQLNKESLLPIIEFFC